jgi:hypothetical protein
MDGLNPSLLLTIKQNDDELIIKTSNETYKLKRVEGDNEVYLYDGNSNTDQYLINSKYLNSYPVIVTDCHEEGASDR